MSITLNGTTGITTPAIDNQGNLTVSGALNTTGLSASTAGLLTVPSGASIYTVGSGTFGLNVAGELTIASGRDNGGDTIVKTSNTERMRIDGAGRVTTPYQPAFDVASSVGVAGDSYQTFNTTYLNVGSNFGNNRFTAPVAGVYQFFATTIKGSASDTDVVRVYLHVNGTVTRGSRHVRLSEGSTYGENGVGSWLLNLSASDYVQVYIGQNSSHSNVEYTYFNGYLVG
jgi:hypothetical protein